MTEKLFEAKKRSLEMITLPAKERYMQFIKGKTQCYKARSLKTYSHLFRHHRYFAKQNTKGGLLRKSCRFKNYQ